MKHFILLLFFFLFLAFYLPIPPYVELNQLHIIQKIGVDCENNSYRIYLKEVIPVKEEQGMTYHYQIYEEEGVNLDSTLEEMKKKEKYLYFQKATSLITNCKEKEKIQKVFSLSKKKIHMTDQNIKKEFS